MSLTLVKPCQDRGKHQDIKSDEITSGWLGSGVSETVLSRVSPQVC